MQVKLLRVIQEKAVRPVGEQRENPVDVRVLSATHKNLADLVSQGRFREDLFYRINVIELRVPALREHPEDIADLVDAMLQRLASRNGATSARLSAEARAALNRYPFPGNVRELENILERAIALSASGTIEAVDLQLRPLTPASPPVSTPDLPVAPNPLFDSLSATAPSARAGSMAADASLGDRLETMERDAIVRALEKTRYNKTAAARLLGMSFRALRYRVKKLGIE
jgi:two-component system response regulator PilR (NtrC family)